MEAVAVLKTWCKTEKEMIGQIRKLFKRYDDNEVGNETLVQSIVKLFDANKELIVNGDGKLKDNVKLRLGKSRYKRMNYIIKDIKGYGII